MMKRKNEKRVKKNERDNGLLCFFAGTIASVLAFSGSFTRRWLKEMKMLLNQWFCCTKIEVLPTAKQMCLKEHALNLTESSKVTLVITSNCMFKN